MYIYMYTTVTNCIANPPRSAYKSEYGVYSELRRWRKVEWRNDGEVKTNVTKMTIRLLKMTVVNSYGVSTVTSIWIASYEHFINKLEYTCSCYYNLYSFILCVYSSFKLKMSVFVRTSPFLSVTATVIAIVSILANHTCACSRTRTYAVSRSSSFKHGKFLQHFWQNILFRG